MAVAHQIQHDTDEGWLAERRKYINASEVGTILGLGLPFESPTSLWLKKTGQLPEGKPSLPARIGIALEPEIAKEYERMTGRVLEDPGARESKFHPKYPWLRCTRDRITVFENNKQGPVELKHVFGGYFNDDGEWCPPDSHLESWSQNKAPLKFEAQLQIQMACMGASIGEIAALIGNTEVVVIRLAFDEELFEDMVPTLLNFLNCCQTGTPPETDGSEVTYRSIRRLYRDDDDGGSIELEPVAVDAITEWRRLNSVISETEESINVCKAQVVMSLKRNTFGTINGRQVVSHKVNKAGNRVLKLRKVGK